MGHDGVDDRGRALVGQPSDHQPGAEPVDDDEAVRHRVAAAHFLDVHRVELSRTVVLAVAPEPVQSQDASLVYQAARAREAELVHVHPHGGPVESALELCEHAADVVPQLSVDELHELGPLLHWYHYSRLRVARVEEHDAVGADHAVLLCTVGVPLQGAPLRHRSSERHQACRQVGSADVVVVQRVVHEVVVVDYALGETASSVRRRWVHRGLVRRSETIRQPLCESQLVAVGGCEKRLEPRFELLDSHARDVAQSIHGRGRSHDAGHRGTVRCHCNDVRKEGARHDPAEIRRRNGDLGRGLQQTESVLVEGTIVLDRDDRQQVQGQQAGEVATRCEQRRTNRGSLDCARDDDGEGPGTAQLSGVRIAGADRVAGRAPALNDAGDLSRVGARRNPNVGVGPVGIAHSCQKQIDGGQKTAARQRPRPIATVPRQRVGTSVLRPGQVLDGIVDVGDRSKVVRADRTLGHRIDEDEAALVRLHTEWERRRKSVDSGTADAL